MQTQEEPPCPRRCRRLPANQCARDSYPHPRVFSAFGSTEPAWAALPGNPHSWEVSSSHQPLLQCWTWAEIGQKAKIFGGPQVWWPPGEETITMRDSVLIKKSNCLEFGHQKILQRRCTLKEHQNSLLVSHTWGTLGKDCCPCPVLVGRCMQELWAGWCYVFQRPHVATAPSWLHGRRSCGDFW